MSPSAYKPTQNSLRSCIRYVPNVQFCLSIDHGCRFLVIWPLSNKNPQTYPITGNINFIYSLINSNMIVFTMVLFHIFDPTTTVNNNYNNNDVDDDDDDSPNILYNIQYLL